MKKYPFFFKDHKPVISGHDIHIYLHGFGYLGIDNSIDPSIYFSVIYLFTMYASTRKKKNKVEKQMVSTSGTYLTLTANGYYFASLKSFRPKIRKVYWKLLLVAGIEIILLHVNRDSRL